MLHTHTNYQSLSIFERQGGKGHKRNVKGASSTSARCSVGVFIFGVGWKTVRTIEENVSGGNGGGMGERDVPRGWQMSSTS
jgi:hypothetical protein